MMNKFDIHTIPVFRPTWEEFKDFNKYIQHIESLGAHHAGICKIIPPKEWVPRKRGYDDLDDFVIETPYKQVAHGGQGVFMQAISSKPKMTVRAIKALSNTPAHQTPDHADWAHLERKYWANMGLSSALYGSDICGSITDPDQEHWNIANLGSILDTVFAETGIQIKGVNTPYLYFGTWRATFGWHTEDVDLYSINYLHYGMPKQWYVIPPAYARRFEAFARECFKRDYMDCKAFLRHKTCVIAPSVLINAGIVVNKITHEQGEIMITFPYGYHAGFNLGFNMAESTNFASPRWIEYGKKATSCRCNPDTVKIQMDPFVRLFQKDKFKAWRRGEDDTPHPLTMYDPPYKRSMKRVLVEQARVVESTSSGADTSMESAKTGSSDESGARKRKFGSGKTRDETDGGKATKWSYQRRHCDVSDSPLKKLSENGKPPPDYLNRFPDLWLDVNCHFEAEKSYNDLMGRLSPHCAICLILWTPPRVASVLSGESEPLPTVSRLPRLSEPQVPEHAYAKDDVLRADLFPHSANSPLLRCNRCNITVHARCYGVTELDSEDGPGLKRDWLCDRCRSGGEETHCCMCPIRGGALKRIQGTPPQTTDTIDEPPQKPRRGRPRKKQPAPSPAVEDSAPATELWAHVVCSLGTWDIRYTDIPKRQARLPSYKPEWSSLRCAHCSLRNATTPLAKCVYSACKTHLHVTCAHFAGVLIESLNHPWTFYITCLKHKKMYMKFNERKYPRVTVGDVVYAKHTYNRRYYEARLKKLVSPAHYSIDFLDGTFSTDTPPNYVLGRDCEEEGPPPIGSHIRVLWHDDDEYEGIFKGTTLEKWEVEFDNGEVLVLSRELLYKAEEDIPTRVMKKISAYSQKKEKL